MEAQWHIARNKQRVGPFSTSEMQRLAETGRLARHEMVLRVGDQKWCPAGSVPLLFKEEAVGQGQPSANLPVPNRSFRLFGGRRVLVGGTVLVVILLVLAFVTYSATRTTATGTVEADPSGSADAEEADEPPPKDGADLPGRPTSLPPKADAGNSGPDSGGEGQPASLAEAERSAMVRKVLKEANEAVSAEKEAANIEYALADLAPAHCKAGDLAGALKLAGRVEGGPAARVYRKIAAAQAEIRDAEGAFRTIERFGNGLGPFEVLEKCERYAQVAMLLKQSTERAATAEQMLALRALLEKQLVLARQLALALDDADFDLFISGALRDVGVAQARIGDVKGARATLTALRKGKGDQDWMRVSRCSVLASIAAAHAETGDFDAAVRAIDEMESNVVYRDSALAAVAAAAAKAGRTKEAFKYAGSIDQSVMKAIACSEVAEHLVAGGQRDQAAAILRDTTALAAGERHPERKRMILRALGVAQARTGDAVGAFKSADAIKTVPAIDGGDLGNRAEVLAEIGLLQARSNDPAASRKTFQAALQAIKGQAIAQHHEYRLIALAQTRAGEPDSAFAWASREPNTRTKVAALVAIATGLLEHRASVFGNGQARQIVNSIGMRLVLIKAGSFAMGTPSSERGSHRRERPKHSVAFAKPFYMGAYEVTQSQYEKVMG
ncbi:MAG: GYF domain-containing protein, partial [Gemmataceae bacterium]|nr:GYF domain-containing protein [Gemmataceae bacterium]